MAVPGSENTACVVKKFPEKEKWLSNVLDVKNSMHRMTGSRNGTTPAQGNNGQSLGQLGNHNRSGGCRRITCFGTCQTAEFFKVNT